MTVKDLRQEIVNAGLNERGLMTRLKRKQDLIAFLELHHQGNQPTSEVSPPGREEEEVSITKDLVENFEPKDAETPSESPIPSEPQLAEVDSAIREILPPWMQSNLVKNEITSLLPIQEESFLRIYKGEDMVLHAPTGQGKTLAFCLPLLAKETESTPQKRRSTKSDLATPEIVCIVPSRELAQQVGKEFDRFQNKDQRRAGGVATVFGGVPIERHTSLLKRTRPKVLVATPGRLRELVREGHVSYERVQTLVLDEADILLDASDSPDVQAILKNLEEAVEGRIEESGADEDAEAYQMVLVSATLNVDVRTFLKEMEIPKQALCSVQASSMTHGTRDPARSTIGTSKVNHWHLSCKGSAQVDVAGDLISTLSPQVTIIFVPTKSETEDVAEHLARKLGGSGQISIKPLHGDMAQSARTRTLNQIRLEQQGDAAIRHILVATDVASRGIDLPRVELVVQFGIPRQSGKEGTYNTDLYIHRTGRAGRVRQGSSTTDSNAILLVDPTTAERRLLDEFITDLKKDIGISISSRPIPSPKHIIDAGFERSLQTLSKSASSSELVVYFKDRLRNELNEETLQDPEALLDSLAKAMSHLSALDRSMSPSSPNRSLLSGDSNLRTIEIRAPSAIKPSDITAFCKGLGSGKVGMVTICEEARRAIVDLPTKKALRFLKEWEERSDEFAGWSVSLPNHLDTK